MFRAEPGGRLTITNITVRDLILRAYQIRPFELSDGPHWIGTERYDVLAKAEGEATGPQLDAIVRSLLASRF